MSRKYKFNFTSVLGGVLVLGLLLYLASCTKPIYYEPEYLDMMRMQDEIDSIADAKRATAKQDQIKARLAARQAQKDSALRKKERRMQKILDRKKERELKAKQRQALIKRRQDSIANLRKPKDAALPKPAVAPPSTASPTTAPSPSPSTPQVTPTPTKEKKKPEKEIKKEFKVSKDAIKNVFTQSARDIATFDQHGNMTLIGGTSNKFQDMNLDSDTIVYDYKTRRLEAIPKKDSSGSGQKIDFKQGSKLFKMESMIYNPINKKAIFTNLQTKEGELFVHTKKVKQVNDSVFYGSDGIFSTCNYFPPHFSFRTNKYKLVRGRTIVTGSLYVNFEGVPIPPKVFLFPFAILPMPKERNSGVIIPEIQPYGINGFSLNNGGYYFVLSPFIDLKVLGSYSALGVYAGSLASNFMKKYRYTGNASFDMQVISKGVNPGDADYRRNINYRINATYNLDKNVNPTISFNARVNYISNSEYNVLASNVSAQDRLNNSFTSNVSFRKNLRKGFVESINTTLTLSQNTNTGLIDMTLPDLQIATRPINPIYLFTQRKNLGTKWYDKLRLGYSLSFQNRASINQNQFSFAEILEKSKWNARQSFPLTLSLPKLGPLVITPGITYNQELVDRRTIYRWNSEAGGKIDTIKERGIYPRHSLSTSLTFNFEDLIATLQFGPKSRLRALRHVIRFSPGLSYTPDVKSWEYYSFQSDAKGTIKRLNYFDGSSYRKQESGSITFSMTNVIQAKWRMKKHGVNGDTSKIKEEEKKIDLINFSLNASYDLMADSFNLSNISTTYTTRISDKLTLAGDLSFDPYVYDGGRRTARLLVENGNITLGSLLSGRVSFSYGIKGGDKKKSSTSPASSPPSTHDHPTPSNTETYPGERYDILNQTRDLIARHPNDFTDFNIPWSLNFGVGANYSRGYYDTEAKKFNSHFTFNVNINGDVSLTQKWKLGASGMYDVIKGELSSVQLRLSRDLHCWQLSISLVPIGPIKSFSFLVQPKSRMLQDLKIDQNRNFF